MKNMTRSDAQWAKGPLGRRPTSVSWLSFFGPGRLGRNGTATELCLEAEKASQTNQQQPVMLTNAKKEMNGLKPRVAKLALATHF